jgi:tetratricopeptide (TPR) repeat protein
LKGQIGLRDMLALLRSSDGDPWFFGMFSRELLSLVAQAPRSVTLEMMTELERVVKHHFPATDGSDVCFDVGMICQLLGRPREALDMYQRSLEYFGEAAATRHNMGLCYYQLDQNRAALAMFEQVLAVEPEHEQARRFRERVAPLLEAVSA